MGETINPVYVKLGGSFLTYKDKLFKVNADALKKTYEILRRVIGKAEILLGNGGGGFAHPVVARYRLGRIDELIVYCQRATRLLNSLLVNYLVARGVKATSVQTSSFLVYDGEYRVFPDPIIYALKNNVIPVVYGECIFSNGGYRIVSTEKVFEVLSKHIRPRHIVLLTDVDGIYSCDPRRCREPVLIKYISEKNIGEVLDTLKTTVKSDATGGVYGKVRSMYELSRRLGARIYILSGFNVDEAVKAIMGEEVLYGTVIEP